LDDLSLDPYRHTLAIHALVDSLLAPLGSPTALDSATFQAAVALMAHPGSATNPARRPVWVAEPVATADTLTPTQLAVLRTWARSAPLPPLWGYRVGLGAPETPWVLPTRAWRHVLQFVKQNEREADSALVLGEVATAVLRARETIGAARHFTDQPLAMDMVIGRATMMRGAKLLARATRQGDDPATSSQANRLAALVRANYAFGHPQMVRLYTMGADVADGRLEAIAADRSLPAGLRVATLEAALVGVCLRTREVLLGASSERHDALAQLARAVSDIPRTGELVPAFIGVLDDFDRDGVASQAGRAARGEDEGRMAVQWMVPTGVRQRYAFCRGVM